MFHAKQGQWGSPNVHNSHTLACILLYTCVHTSHIYMHDIHIICVYACMRCPEEIFFAGLARRLFESMQLLVLFRDCKYSREMTWLNVSLASLHDQLEIGSVGCGSWCSLQTLSEHVQLQFLGEVCPCVWCMTCFEWLLLLQLGLWYGPNALPLLDFQALPCFAIQRFLWLCKSIFRWPKVSIIQPDCHCVSTWGYIYSLAIILLHVYAHLLICGRPVLQIHHLTWFQLTYATQSRTRNQWDMSKDMSGCQHM